MNPAYPTSGPAPKRPASILRQCADSLSAIFFPSSCSICDGELTGAFGVPVCPECWNSLTPWQGVMCLRCGVPFASDANSAVPACAQCRTEEPAFDRARSYGLYAGALRKLILQLKFGRQERLGYRLGSLLYALWQNSGVSATDAPILVPIPLHRARQRERGFNQADLLARGLASEWRRRSGESRRGPFTVETRFLKRTRPTLPQTGLHLTARHENVRGAFRVVRPDVVRERTVVLIDDVMTTGATASACAAAIKKAGAQFVSVLTLARATPQFPDGVAG